MAFPIFAAAPGVLLYIDLPNMVLLHQLEIHTLKIIRWPTAAIKFSFKELK
jgi:hypothetical protein